jgi:alkylated DNA repair protein alkB family protein 1
MADLTHFIANVLGFDNFKAEAAIANYYHLDSTLSGHVDKSEANMEAPLFSLRYTNYSYCALCMPFTILT